MATGLVVTEFVWRHSIAYPRIPPTRCKRHCDIFYTRGVIACFVSNFVAMATKVGRCKIWLTSFDSPTPKTPCISYTRQVITDFVPNFVAMATGYMATGLVAVQIVWRHSIARPRKPPVIRKDLRVSLIQAEL